MDIDLSRIRSVHFVGIKGVAMTALALYCKERGMTVTGSDVEEDFPTKESLSQASINPFIGFSPSHIHREAQPDLVVYTGAHSGIDNMEVQEAVRLGIPVLPHGKALGLFMDGSTQICVAGSHGKTTTTAMIATILSVCGKNPSYAVGCGDITGIGYPGHFGKSTYFVAEADEYITDPQHDKTPRFLWLHPEILVVTNIDFDHPDAYTSIEDVQKAFIVLQSNMVGKKITIMNGDNPYTSVLKTQGNSITFGLKPANDWYATDITFHEGETTFSVMHNSQLFGSFSLHVPGTCNVMNALGAIAACNSIGLSTEEIRLALSKFAGTKRRFQYVGSIKKAMVFDDYAHHPHEIMASLEGIRAWYPKKRIITVFQPHTYSRTRALLQEFAQSFTLSDIVLLPDIYASARESKATDISSEILTQAMKKFQEQVYYIKNLDGVLTFLRPILTDNDIIICMGAGDIYDWSKEILVMLK